MDNICNYIYLYHETKMALVVWGLCTESDQCEQRSLWTAKEIAGECYKQYCDVNGYICTLLNNP